MSTFHVSQLQGTKNKNHTKKILRLAQKEIRRNNEINTALKYTTRLKSLFYPAMSPLGSVLKTFAKSAVKGGAITMTSTVFSCALACYIEIGAHRAVYKYFPHKYANVQRANGLTQEQLDAVRIHQIPVDNTVQTKFEEEEELKDESFREAKPMHILSKLEEKSQDLFWKEGETDTPTWPASIAIIPSQEIIACSMTG